MSSFLDCGSDLVSEMNSERENEFHTQNHKEKYAIAEKILNNGIKKRERAVKCEGNN